jgi:4'-phosphopantetheinyl transferase EntD
MYPLRLTHTEPIFICAFAPIPSGSCGSIARHLVEDVIAAASNEDRPIGIHIEPHYDEKTVASLVIV